MRSAQCAMRAVSCALRIRLVGLQWYWSALRTKLNVSITIQTKRQTMPKRHKREQERANNNKIPKKNWNKNIINIDFYEKCCWRLAIAAVVFVGEGEERGREVKIETSWQRSANETSNRTSWILGRLAMLYNLCAQLIFMQFSFSNLNSLFFFSRSRHWQLPSNERQ